MLDNNADSNVLDDGEIEELERISNSVVDLIRDARLDDAARACFELKRRFPGFHDWMERSALVHEARGEVSQAIEHYRQLIDYINKHPDGFDEDSVSWYREKIEQLARVISSRPRARPDR